MNALVPALFSLAFGLIGLGREDPTQKLSFLLGNWESHESSHDSSGKTVEFTLKGSNRWSLDGKALLIEESFNIPAYGNISNLILMRYDEQAKLFRAWWHTTSIPNPIEFQGAFEGPKLTLTSEKSSLRIIYDPVKDGEYKAALEVKRGDKWVNQTTAEYKRLKD